MTVELPPQTRLANLGQVTKFTDSEFLLEQIDYKEPPNLSYQFHTVKSDDEITQIAYQYYKDIVDMPSQYYWVICLSNGIFTPYDLTEFYGKRIRIPDVLEFLNRI